MIQKYYFKLLFLWCRFMHEDLETAKIEELTLAIKNCKVFVYCLFFSFIYDNFWVCFFIIWKLFLKESGKIDIPHNLLQIQWSNQSIDLRGKRYCIAIHLICMLYLNIVLLLSRWLYAVCLTSLNKIRNAETCFYISRNNCSRSLQLLSSERAWSGRVQNWAWK